jgi:hypothetical protein
MAPRRSGQKDQLEPLTDAAIVPNSELQTIQTGRRIAILARLEAGERPADIARREKVCLSTVDNIRNDPHLRELSDGKMVERTKELMSAKFYLASDALLDEAMRPEKRAKLRTTEAMLAAGIAVDKARLLEGKSTENVSIRGVVAHLQAQLSDAALLRRTLLDSIGSVTE